jgi:hypothetical protein
MKRVRAERCMIVVVGIVASATMLFRLFVSRALLIDLPAACPFRLQKILQESMDSFLRLRCTRGTVDG